MQLRLVIGEGVHDACGSGAVRNEACEPGNEPEQVFEQVDREPDVVELCSDVVEQVDQAYSDVGIVEIVANTGQVGGAGHGSRDDEVGGQVDQVSCDDGHGAVVNSGGCGIERVDKVCGAEAVIVKKKETLQGPKLELDKPKLAKSLPEKRKESPCVMSNSVKKRSTPLVGNKGRKSENKIIKNQNLITKHFQPISTAPRLGDGQRVGELHGGGGVGQAVPRARANAGTGQSVGGKTVQTVTVVTIGQGQSAAGNLTNSGRGYCS